MAVKQVRKLMESPEGQQALRDGLGMKLDFNHRDSGLILPESKPIVAVLMPTAEVPEKRTQEAYAKMHSFSSRFCDILPQPAQSGSIIHFLRNQMLVDLYATKQHFDFVLFTDDDMEPGVDDLSRLLAHKKDVVGAATVSRHWPYLPTFKFFDEKIGDFRVPSEWGSEEASEGLLKIDAVGTGFTLYSRKALDAARDYYLDCLHEQRYFGMSEEFAAEMSKRRRLAFAEEGNAWWFECLKRPNGKGEWGEDVSFCFKMREMGVEVYVDTEVQTGHLGVWSFKIADFYVARDILRKRAQKK